MCMCVYVYMAVYIRMYISIKPAADDLPGKTLRAPVSRHCSQKYSDIRYYDLDCSYSTCSGLLVSAGSKQHLQQALNT